jgi:hypothetical protein
MIGSGGAVDAYEVFVAMASSSSSSSAEQEGGEGEQEQEEEEGGYGRCLPHDMGLVQSMLTSSSGSSRKSFSFAMYAGFVAGGPDDDDAEDDDISGWFV